MAEMSALFRAKNFRRGLPSNQIFEIRRLYPSWAQQV